MLWHDAEVTPDSGRVVIDPVATEISGVVRREKMPVEGVFITVADGRDVKMIVGTAKTDSSGRYSIPIFQSGEVLVYTNGPYAGRTSSLASAVPEPVTKRVRLTGEARVRVDFQLPTSGATIIVVDAESRAPVRATARGMLTDSRGRGMSIYLETDDRGITKIAGAREGTAKVFVNAKGYRGRDVTISVGSDRPETTIELTRGGSVTGRVLDSAGAAVAGAQVLGGFATPIAPQGSVQTSTDSSGRFEIEGAERGTTFYVVAGGHALAVTTLREGAENVIRLAPPNAGALRVVAEKGPLERLPFILAAPRGGTIIPQGVLMELAEANGMSIFQLASAGSDGMLILPEFLPPGHYSLYRMRPAGKSFAETFVPVGDVRVPATAGALVTIPE